MHAPCCCADALAVSHTSWASGVGADGGGEAGVDDVVKMLHDEWYALLAVQQRQPQFVAPTANMNIGQLPGLSASWHCAASAHAPEVAKEPRMTPWLAPSHDASENVATSGGGEGLGSVQLEATWRASSQSAREVVVRA